MTQTTYESDRDNPLRQAIHTVLAAAPDYSRTENPAMRRRDAALGDMVTRLDEAVPQLAQGLGLASLGLRAASGASWAACGAAISTWRPAPSG
jgi:hypothetical protein